MKEEYNTLEFYNKNAEEYFNQTIVGDVQENYDRFLKNLPSNAYILDFGCGSGRDSKYLSRMDIE
jgi:2-polyprenyl-3-methyl-5-hydroxy-6-metoxy-1,4-benzoquinol methylase